MLQGFVRANAVIGSGIALFAVLFLPAFFVDMPDPYGILLVWAPFLGASIASYRISREFPPGRRAAWLLGGGLGLGLVAWICCAYLLLVLGRTAT